MEFKQNLKFEIFFEIWNFIEFLKADQEETLDLNVYAPIKDISFLQLNKLVDKVKNS